MNEWFKIADRFRRKNIIRKAQEDGMSPVEVYKMAAKYGVANEPEVINYLKNRDLLQAESAQRTGEEEMANIINPPKIPNAVTYNDYQQNADKLQFKLQQSADPEKDIADYNNEMIKLNRQRQSYVNSERPIFRDDMPQYYSGTAQKTIDTYKQKGKAIVQNNKNNAAASKIAAIGEGFNNNAMDKFVKIIEATGGDFTSEPVQEAIKAQKVKTIANYIIKQGGKNYSAMYGNPMQAISDAASKFGISPDDEILKGVQEAINLYKDPIKWYEANTARFSAGTERKLADLDYFKTLNDVIKTMNTIENDIVNRNLTKEETKTKSYDAMAILYELLNKSKGAVETDFGVNIYEDLKNPDMQKALEQQLKKINNASENSENPEAKKAATEMKLHLLELTKGLYSGADRQGAKFDFPQEVLNNMLGNLAGSISSKNEIDNIIVNKDISSINNLIDNEIERINNSGVLTNEAKNQQEEQLRSQKKANILNPGTKNISGNVSEKKKALSKSRAFDYNIKD